VIISEACGGGDTAEGQRGTARRTVSKQADFSIRRQVNKH
jgi:hypothetical protein